MRELEAMLALGYLLLDGEPEEGSSEPRTPILPPGSPAEDRVGRITTSLLDFGCELRSELPDPQRALDSVAATVVEVAYLLARECSWADDPLERLGTLQRERMVRPKESGEGAVEAPRKLEPPQVHLGRAFWQLAGLAREVISGDPGDGQLEEHGADLANYLVFATTTSGLWEELWESIFEGRGVGGGGEEEPSRSALGGG